MGVSAVRVEGVALVLVELSVVEQRYQAVLEVLNDGATVTDVARRNGVTRQTVHAWLRRYASRGLAGLADGSARPLSCPHQMPPEVEGADRGAASGASGVGSTHDPASARPGRGGRRCRRGRRSIGVWSVTVDRRRGRGNGSGRTTSGGSGRGRWSCGRWTSSVASRSSTGRRRRSCPGSMITRRFVHLGAGGGAGDGTADV